MVQRARARRPTYRSALACCMTERCVCQPPGLPNFRKVLGKIGGRTRIRTLDPLTKSQRFMQSVPRLGCKHRGSAPQEPTGCGRSVNRCLPRRPQSPCAGLLIQSDARQHAGQRFGYRIRRNYSAGVRNPQRTCPLLATEAHSSAGSRSNYPCEPVKAACPRVAQPVKRDSTSAAIAYMATPRNAMTSRPAKTSGTLKEELADSIR